MAQGVVGEIYISGINVARGYINNPQLTAERFIPNPFVTNGDSIYEKMYKSGDLGRWLSDGTLEFVGRVDHQVKIRGFRVELGEIENQLLAHPDVKETVVTVQQNQSKDKFLCAYLVTDRELTTLKLKEYLSKRLARYMIPTQFIILDKMPLTSSGKISRRELPNPEDIEKGEFIAPRNALEAKLLEIWQEVLGREQIGVTDDFFEVGGHSLKATRLAAYIFKKMDVEISLLEIFEKPTLVEMAELIAQKEKSTYSIIEPVEVEEYYPASSAQKRLFVLDQLDKNSLSYNMPSIRIIEDEVDPERLEIVLNELIKRHEVLRTSFELVDGVTVQKVHEAVEFKINYLHLESDNDKIEKIVQNFIRPFDLGQAPLLRVELVKLEDKHLLMIDMHHIISDGVSRNIFFNELLKLYDGEELPPLRIQYKDFAVWQNKLLQSEKMKKHEDYWLETFVGEGNEIPVLNLPTDYPRPAIMSFEGEGYRFQIDKELTIQLNKLASKNGATLFMVLLSVYNILLSKYSGQEDIVVGTPIEGRTHADLELVMGMFVNTLALRNKPQAQKVYQEFLEEIKYNSIKAYENQDYQFEMLVDKLKLKRNIGRNPLFDTMFSLQNVHDRRNSNNESKSSSNNFSHRIAKFDLSLAAVELNDGIQLSFEYSTKLFIKATIERLAEHFENIIQTIVKHPEIILAEIEMISGEEKEQLLYAFNDTKAEYPKDKTISHLFEERVDQIPESTALIMQEGEQLVEVTYRELNEKANQLARNLRHRGVKPGSIVGMMTERSVEMIIGILGVLKAGGAYLPIDLNYPNERIEFILKDSNADLLLIQNRLQDEINFTGEVIDLMNENLYLGDVSNLENISSPDELAYIIYTSGSTGNPKGVMIEQRGLVNYVFCQQSLSTGRNSRFPTVLFTCF